MKRFYLAALLILVATLAFGLEVHVTDTPTISWDPVEVANGTLSYEVAVRDPGGTQYTLGEVTAPPATLDLSPYPWQRVVGVRSKLVVDGSSLYSEWIWSDSTDTEYVPVPFVFAPAVPAPGNLRVLP